MMSNLFPEITANKKKLKQILSAHQTPVFISDRAIIKKRFNDLDQALDQYWGTNHAIAYSLKTNYDLTAPIKKLGAWAEVVSGREFELALKYRFHSKSIIYNGPFKTPESLEKALSSKAIVNIDNAREFYTIKSLAKKIKRIEICLRLNLYKRDYRFGIPVNSPEILKIISIIRNSERIQLAGFHIHIGSDINKVSAYGYAATALVRFLKSLDPGLLSLVKYLDIGGGFPAGGLKPFYYKEWQPEPISHYIKTVTEIIRPVFNRQKLPKLIVEPGRYLTDDSTMFITKVINCKNTPLGQVLTADGAITMLPLIYYRPQIVKLYSSELILKKASIQKSLVYGSTCKQDDILYQKPLPAAKVNNYLIFFCTGAYNLNLSPVFIFDLPKTYFI